MKRKSEIKKCISVKRTAMLYLLIISVVMLAGCGGKTNVYPKQQEKSGVETKSKDNKVGIPEQKDNNTDYLEAYYSVVSDFIYQYGEYVKDPDTSAITGLKYGELIDFEKDGVPEMLLVCDRTAYIYGFDGSKAVELLNTPIGSGFGQTDVSYYVYISYVNGQQYLIVDNVDDGWCEDNFMAYTVSDGEVYQMHYAAWTDGNNEYPSTEFLTSFEINDEAVSADEYLQDRSTLRDNARSIDAIWDLSATYDELMTFESSLY